MPPDLFSQIQAGEMKTLNLIVKADVQGSAEAVKSSLEKISNDEVRVKVIHSAVGAISESDVMLAATSDAIIVGFNVPRLPTPSSSASMSVRTMPRETARPAAMWTSASTASSTTASTRSRMP